MSDVPPGRQCIMPSCDAAAVDPSDTTPLCASHHATATDDRDDENETEETGAENTRNTWPPSTEARGDHENPIDVSDVTDAERADMLVEYLEAFEREFDRVPRLMPLDEEGKAPIIQGRCRLDSPEGRSYLVDGDDAANQIRDDGARGFAIYAGKRDHGTHGVAFVDHDDDSFPAPTGDPTLRVMSGSGRADGHETYRNDPDDPVANARVGDNAGEIRAKNWYVVAPGSVHPSGGVYHVVENRDVATLADADLTDEMRPSTGRSDKDVNDDATAYDKDGEGEVPDDDETATRLDAAFSNPHDGDRIEQVYNGRYNAAGFNDRSSAEYWLANRLDSWAGLGSAHAVERLMDDANLQKWAERTDRSYRDSILADVGRQDWYFTPGDDVEHRAVLPDTPRDRAASNGWDWRHAAEQDRRERDGALTIADARERTTGAISNAYEHRDRVLVEALPTLGKSHGSVKAAAESGHPVTILTGRGRKEQYEQFREWCDEYALSYYTLPAFTSDCPTANGEHGDDWKRRVLGWYQHGATPQEIHKYAESVLGRPLPCQTGEHECPYTAKWRFDPEEYDVLIGHYTHAYNEKVTQGRAVVVDEFPGDAYITAFESGLQGPITSFLAATPEIPYDDYTDLLEGRDDDERRVEALSWFDDHGVDRDGRAVFDDDRAHAAAPLAVATILAAADLGNGWERAELGDDRIGLYDRESAAVYVLDPPNLTYGRSVVALDGTPTKAMWELTLGLRLNHRHVLAENERAEYLRDVLNYQFVRTTDAVKPYNTADHIAVDQDVALFEAVHDRHGERPGLLTTSTAESEYEHADVLERDRDGYSGAHVESTLHHGNLLGSNQFGAKRLGIVAGSNHYGDRYIEKWGAFAGETVEREDETNQGKGSNLSYGPFGDDVLTHMREHGTLQAAMRFGRDGNGAVVYVHTNTLPEWVPLAGEGRVLRTRSDGERQVLDSLDDLDTDEWTTADVTGHPAVEIGERQVRNVLHGFVERGYADAEYNGTGYTWRDDGLHRVNDHGDVELDAVELDELDDEEKAETARSSSYTWDFRGTTGKLRETKSGTANGGESRPVDAAVAGPPPGDTD